MKLAKIEVNGKTRDAVYKGGKYYLIKGDMFDIKSVNTSPVKGAVKLLPPVNPTKIVALGANYRKHAEEFNIKVNPDPIIFMKPVTAMIADGENIVLPPDATKVDYEAELAIVIDRDIKNVEECEALKYVLGYTCANDVSERVFQKLDGQWLRAKGFDTFCPIGPYIETEIDASFVDLKTVLNGKVVQSGNTRDMINGLAKTVSFISKVMTLKKGDVILTGTPEGVGQIKAGDTVQIVIEGIGTLTNKVIQGCATSGQMKICGI